MATAREEPSVGSGPFDQGGADMPEPIMRVSNRKPTVGRYRFCGTKVRYTNLGDAVDAADSYMYRIALTYGPMMPYYCPVHSCWHIGHSRKAPPDLTAAYSQACVCRENLRKEIAYLSAVIEKFDEVARGRSTTRMSATCQSINT